MTYIYMTESEEWGSATDFFIVQVSDKELDEMSEDGAYWHHEFLKDRECLRFDSSQGKMVKDTIQI